jgi:hypothetical protein
MAIMYGRLVAAGFLTVALFGTSVFAQAANGTTSGDFWVEPPTLISLGFEWRVDGDDNRNAKVDVDFRKEGETSWRKGMPLVRSSGEYIGPIGPQREDFHPDPMDYTAPNMFAGSLFNLEPDTEYEARFKLADADGVTGEAVKTMSVRTRKEPVPATGGKTYHVYPIGWEGPKQEPAFTGLMEAYYQGAASSDFQGTFPPRVVAGDIILVHAGEYKSDRTRYLNGLPHPGYNALSTLFDGTYYLTADGTADKPIVIKAAGDGEVIFDGDDTQTFFNLMGADYNYFEGITFRNANLVFLIGYKDIVGSSGFTLKNSRLYDIGRGVQADWSGSKYITILDNSFIGRHDPKNVVGWNGQWLKRPEGYEVLGGPDGSEYGVKVYGQGHVVAYNYFANWHDGLDITTYGDPDGTPKEIRDRVPVSIDFYNNDFFNMGDNCIETDGGAHNIRAFRNRCYNSVGGALSATPLAGGPVYFFQNVVYNVSTGAATKYSSSVNTLTFQNTLIGDVRANAPGLYFTNNLILSNSQGAIYAITSQTNYSTSDHNGFRPNDGAVTSFEWSTPPLDVAYARDPDGVVKRTYKTLQEYAAGSGRDKNSVLVDYSIFAKASAPDRKDMEKIYAPEDSDFTLKRGSAAIDAGAVMPNINDGFTGKAPDIGAYEIGKPIPDYGPRTPVPGKPWGDQAVRSLAGPPTIK